MDMSGTEGTRFCSVWSPTGDRLASSGGSSISVRAVAMPSTEGTEKKIDLTLLFYIANAHSNYIMCLFFSGDGRTLVSGSKDRNVNVFDMEADGALLHTLSGYKGAVMTLFCSSDGYRLVTGGEDATVLVWTSREEVEAKQRKAVQPYPVQWEFTSNGETLVTSNSQSKSHNKWDMKTGLYHWNAI